ncbi:hypothetical protein WR25_03077 isoform C [Diploscapter pachys]|uniref:Serine/threonine-protein phosphatase n=1 Tax=Diploscapter pachys TaxID=2018661 RepID=A0A2A2L5R2_9BILA|nr:hypothetical protein WR25_03077 isoform A [Diploscapter pachys]PAV81586.1 hypothetical protein WR25_03077 isoform C [Diploscapter pachys]
MSDALPQDLRDIIKSQQDQASGSRSRSCETSISGSGKITLPVLPPIGGSHAIEEDPPSTATYRVVSGKKIRDSAAEIETFPSIYPKLSPRSLENKQLDEMAKDMNTIRIPDDDLIDKFSVIGEPQIVGIFDPSEKEIRYDLNLDEIPDDEILSRRLSTTSSMNSYETTPRNPNKLSKDIPGLKEVIESMSMREFNKIIMVCRKCDTESHGLLNETAILECIKKIFPESSSAISPWSQLLRSIAPNGELIDYEGLADLIKSTVSIGPRKMRRMSTMDSISNLPDVLTSKHYVQAMLPQLPSRPSSSQERRERGRLQVMTDIEVLMMRQPGLQSEVKDVKIDAAGKCFVANAHGMKDPFSRGKSNFIVNPDTAPQLAQRMINRITTDGTLSIFSNKQIHTILDEAIKVMAPEPAMLQLELPINIFGDIHGQLNDLLRLFTIVGTPADKRMLFLGDYVDRCKKSFEVITLLLCYKILYPKNIFLLRGNHESAKMNRLYGFYEEMKHKRNPRMWVRFQKVFCESPLCALVGKVIFCMHGGISDKIKDMDDLFQLEKPRTQKDTNAGISCDLLWSDPTSQVAGFAPNEVG